MLTPRPPEPHQWYTPAECAALLGGRRHGAGWRAKCPAHGGNNPDALSIAQGQDNYGNPITLLYCHAHQCSVADICAAIGIQVKNLFCIHPTYARETQRRPQTHSPQLAEIKRTNTLPPGGIAQVMLEEMIVSDPEWIQSCAPARKTLWEIAQASPQARAAFTHALQLAHLHPMRFWDTLGAEYTAGRLAPSEGNPSHA